MTIRKPYPYNVDKESYKILMDIISMNRSRYLCVHCCYNRWWLSQIIIDKTNIRESCKTITDLNKRCGPIQVRCVSRVIKRTYDSTRYL